MQIMYGAKARHWFNFFSMERSGHVAVLNWLMQQCPQPCVKVTPPHVPDGIPGAGYYYPGMVPMKNKTWSAEPPGEEPLIASINFRDEGLFSPKGYPQAKNSVIMVRDIRNLLASRKKHERGWNLEETTRTWCEYARVFLGESSIKPWPLVCVTYNQWFTDAKYRRSIVDNINAAFGYGLQFTDAGLNEVPPSGRGSSFDRLQFQDRGQQMRTLERYKQVDVSKYVTDEARALDERIFGPWE